MKHFKSITTTFDDPSDFYLSDATEVHGDQNDDEDTDAFSRLDDHRCMNQRGCVYLGICGEAVCIYCGRKG